MSRHLTIPTADTQLYTVDNPGGAPPLLFLSGGFGTIHNWNRVIDRLGGRYRAVLFDARARGKSGTCSTSRESSRSGHSFAALPGLCASLPRSAARRICRPIKQRTW